MTTSRANRKVYACEVCGVDISSDSRRCTNGRCSGCHGTHCTPGGATSPGHGRGNVATPFASDSIQQRLRADSVKRGQTDYCERCDERLDSTKAVWLELNTNTRRYAEAGTVPEAESQGCFTFGPACARAVLKAGGENERIKGRT